jgi:hypothetical protein
MATIDDKRLIDALIAAGGHYEDDPDVAVIVEYTNASGGTCWGVTWVHESPERQRRYLQATAYVQAPRLLWAREGFPAPDGVTRLPAQPCPLCGETLSAAGPVADDGRAVGPAPGDWTICAYCLQWLVFRDGGGFRPVTGREWLALTPDERVQLTAQREQVRRAWAARPPT